MKDKQFKGGPYFLNSGGIGPDRYVLRCLPRGRWYEVIVRTKAGREMYYADLAGLKFVCQRLQHVCVSDNAHVYAQRRDTIQTLSFWEFANQFGKSEFRKAFAELLEAVR